MPSWFAPREHEFRNGLMVLAVPFEWEERWKTAPNDSDSFLPNLEIRTAHFWEFSFWPWISSSQKLKMKTNFFHSIMTRKKSCFGVQNQEQIRWTVSVNNYVFQGMKICLRGNPFDTSFCRICLLNATLIRLNLKIHHHHNLYNVLYFEMNLLSRVQCQLNIIMNLSFFEYRYRQG